VRSHDGLPPIWRPSAATGAATSGWLTMLTTSSMVRRRHASGWPGRRPQARACRWGPAAAMCRSSTPTAPSRQCTPPAARIARRKLDGGPAGARVCGRSTRRFRCAAKPSPCPRPAADCPPWRPLAVRLLSQADRAPQRGPGRAVGPFPAPTCHPPALALLQQDDVADHPNGRHNADCRDGQAAADAGTAATAHAGAAARARHRQSAASAGAPAGLPRLQAGRARQRPPLISPNLALPPPPPPPPPPRPSPPPGHGPGDPDARPPAYGPRAADVRAAANGRRDPPRHPAPPRPPAAARAAALRRRATPGGGGVDGRPRIPTCDAALTPPLPWRAAQVGGLPPDPGARQCDGRQHRPRPPHPQRRQGVRAR
jgi:hypothetical protein